MEATLLDASDLQTLRFRLQNFSHATLPIERLSADDQTAIREHHQKQSTAQIPTPEAAKQNQATLAPLPTKLHLKKVPIVTQFGNYCVPASAEMIASFHAIEMDQYEIAQLSSAMSAGNQGTYPRDMLRAMEKIGFKGSLLDWKNNQQFFQNVLPKIRTALNQEGPIYVSFKPGVFGTMGHGCVIVGYDDRKEELLFHNPWGHAFEKEYQTTALEGSGVVFISPPQAHPIAGEAMIQSIQDKIPSLQNELKQLLSRLKNQNIPFELIWCNRYDTLNDRKFADETAREEGRPMLKLAFRRNPAVIIPYSPKGITQSFFFVTRPPEGGARYYVREITPDGWSQPELKTLGNLTREWPTLLSKQNGNTLWQLPLIEIQQ